MHRVFQSFYKHLYSRRVNYGKSRNFLLPISCFHSVSETQNPNSELDFFVDEFDALHSSKPSNPVSVLSSEPDEINPREVKELTVQISHPWPEWVDLMELVLNRGYFEAGNNPFRNVELGPKEANSIRTACLNFARDQFGLIRFLSRKDIQVIAGCGCPTKDRKVVNSGKRLRAHVGIHEGNVCSSCNLRGDCERAFVKARQDEAGRTVDVMRILLAYGLDSILSTVENKPCQNKIVKQSVRKLLKEMVDCSMQELDSHNPKDRTLQRGHVQVYASPQEKGHIEVPMKQGDWHCPNCNFLNFARNIKCLRCDGLSGERLKQLGEDKDHLPLKKGDWICEKCNFLNFAKNTMCLQCKEKPPKRKLNPGEWECDSCNYINFRRNTVCLKCDHRRSQAPNISKVSAQSEHDNNGNAKHARSKFLFGGENEATNHKSKASYRMDQSSRKGMWSFVEEERDDCCLVTLKEKSKFLDFPIAGGKSSLSQDAQKREKWRLEMIEKGKSAPKTEETDGKFSYNNTQRRRLKGPKLTDDDDDVMAEWFGHEKKMAARTSGHPSEDSGLIVDNCITVGRT